MERSEAPGVVHGLASAAQGKFTSAKVFNINAY